MPDKKLVLIDGNSLLYRAFFALPAELATTAGVPTNAVYGFAMMVVRLLEEERPDCILVAWESGRTFRHEGYRDYKAHRPTTPDDLAVQAPLAREAAEVLRIPAVEVRGYEADDVIGTLARRGKEAGYEVLIVTGDLDALQLVDERTRVMAMRRGITDVVLYDEAAVRQRFGLAPEQLPDFKALKGDPSDNIPGIPGIGDKTASALLARYGNLESLLEHAHAVSPPRVREALEKHTQDARMYRALTTIVTDLPIPRDLVECHYQGPDRSRARALFEQLQFRTLGRRLLAEPEGTPAAPGGVGEGPPRASEPPRCVRLAPGPELDRFVARAVQAGRVAVRARPAHQATFDCQPVAAALATAGEPEAVCLGELPEPGLLAAAADPWELPEGLKSLLQNPRVAVGGHHLKGEIHCLRESGVTLPRPGFDAELAAYVINPGRSSYRIEDLAREYLGLSLEAAANGWERLGQEAAASLRLWPPLERRLVEDGLERLYHELELPLVPILAEMERVGVAVDVGVLNELSALLAQRIARVQAEIHRLAGREFNIGSPKQLQEVLFTEMGLRSGRKTKTGLSTSVEVLEELAAEHPLPALILEYRELTKLKSTYADALANLIHPRDGRIHTTFHQTVAATGRLSSADPNLQNIPIRTESGREIRRAFVAAPGMKLLSADYSQIELRILAHVTGDPELVRAFREGEDVHAATAARMFDIPPDQVTPELRRRGKTLNFAVIYGMSNYGLSRELGIPVKQAQELIEAYFLRFPGVRRYTEETIRLARLQGYVTTLPPYNRRRYIPGIRSGNRTERAFAERAAVNAPIQGTAADIIKAAMLSVDRQLRAAGLGARMILQVHDELLLEYPPAEEARLVPLVHAAMAGARDLDVPLDVDVRVGPNWLEMEPVA
ncbi:MAG: DNA polymerase I [Armatimonadetes bacterium]|nr:DNA polymerase I [Armatimonadota bacterium]